MTVHVLGGGVSGLEGAPRLDKLVTTVTCLRAWQSDFGIDTGGTPLASGTVPPAVTITGTIPKNVAFRLEIESIGARGTATFRYGIANDGTTSPWIETGVVTAATYAMVGAMAGATLNFPVGAYTNDDVYQGTCSSWTDQKNSATAVQATASKQPRILVGVGGRLKLVFDGVDDFLNDTSLDLPAPLTTNSFMWCVAVNNSWTLGTGLFSAAQTTGQMRVGAKTATPDMMQSNSTNGNANTAGTLGSLFRLEVLFSGSASDYLKVGATSVSSSVGNANPAAGFLIGAATTTAGSGNQSEIYSLLVFNGKPSASELAALSAAAAAMYPGVAT